MREQRIDQQCNGCGATLVDADWHTLQVLLEVPFHKATEDAPNGVSESDLWCRYCVVRCEGEDNCGRLVCTDHDEAELLAYHKANHIRLNRFMEALWERDNETALAWLRAPKYKRRTIPNQWGFASLDD